MTDPQPNGYPRLRICYEPGDSHRGFPWILAKVFHPQFPEGNVLNHYRTLPGAHTAATAVVGGGKPAGGMYG